MDNLSEDNLNAAEEQIPIWRIEITPPPSHNSQQTAPNAPLIPVLLEPGGQILSSDFQLPPSHGLQDNPVLEFGTNSGYNTPSPSNNSQQTVPNAPLIPVPLEPGEQILSSGYANDDDSFPTSTPLSHFQLPPSLEPVFSISPETIVILDSDDYVEPDVQTWDEMEESNGSDQITQLQTDISFDSEHTSSEEEDFGNNDDEAREEDDKEEDDKEEDDKEEDDKEDRDEDVRDEEAEESLLTMTISKSNELVSDTSSKHTEDFIRNQNAIGNNTDGLPDTVSVFVTSETEASYTNVMENEQDILPQVMNSGAGPSFQGGTNMNSDDGFG